MFFRLCVIAALGLCGYWAYDYYVQTQQSQNVFMVGNENFERQDNANIEMVEYLDYSCPGCQKMHPVVKDALAADGQVNYTVKPLDSGHEGGAAARMVYAAGMQGAYMDAHDFIVANGHEITEAAVDRFAAEHGLDAAKLKADMDSTAVSGMLERNFQEFRELGGVVIPAFVIGPDILAYIDADMPPERGLPALFKHARIQYYGTETPEEPSN